MKVLIRLNQIIDRLLDFSGLMAGLLIASIGFIVTIGTIFRYFSYPLHWVEPISIYFFIASSFMGAAYAMKKGEHIRVDILISNLSHRNRDLLDIFTSVIALLFSLLLMWKGCEMVFRTFSSGQKDLSLLEIPLWIPQLFVPLGGLLLSLAIIRRIIIKWYFNIEEGRRD